MPLASSATSEKRSERCGTALGAPPWLSTPLPHIQFLTFTTASLSYVFFFCFPVERHPRSPVPCSPASASWTSAHPIDDPIGPIDGMSPPPKLLKGGGSGFDGRAVMYAEVGEPPPQGFRTPPQSLGMGQSLILILLDSGAPNIFAMGS